MINSKVKPRLFLFPFAGGNYYSFQFMLPLLKDFEVIPLELPGRGKRIREDLLNDLEEASLDYYRQITKTGLSAPFLIYGHSMGAYLAYIVCSMIEKDYKIPICLLVSGNAGPGTFSDRKRYLLSDPEFKEELKELGGFPEELLNDKETYEFFKPILKKDFEIVEKFTSETDPVIKAPIFAMMGSHEVQHDKIGNWNKFTMSDFSYEIMEGGHFFIHHHPARIAQIIKGQYYKLHS